MTLSKLLEIKNNKIRLEEIKKNRFNIVPFVGAGISKGCGLYTWGELLHLIACDYLSKSEIDKLEDCGDFIHYADRIVEVSGNSDIIMKRIREIFAQSNVCKNGIPNLIVSSFSPMIITTNYDNILEEASFNSKMGRLKPLLPCLVGQMNESIQINDRCLLKIHGSIEETQSFLFCSEQYKKFYGEKNKRDGKLIPNYLKRIFTSKKVLFLGCSLEKDYTLDILEECLADYKSITHYAIVPLPSDEDEQLRRNRELARLSIEPIYYPEGDYEAVNLLINYLSDDNNYVKSMEKVLNTIFCEDSEVDEKQKSIIIALLKESFSFTANKYPELFDLDNLMDDFSDDILEIIGINRTQGDTLLGLIKKSFEVYSKSLSVSYNDEVVKCFFKYLSNRAIEENKVEGFLEKKWSIERHIHKESSGSNTWISELSTSEIDEYATGLVESLQYKNGMNFAKIKPFYDSAIELIDLAKNRISFSVRIKLLNCVGAFGPSFSDVDKSIDILEECINLIVNSGNFDKQMMLFLSKCYANLAISRSYCNQDIWSVIEACKQDIKLKKQYCESPVFLSRSLNFYATVLKEVQPFDALDVYLDATRMKTELIIKDPNNSELVASWATTIFNIGLLAKDCELYELAYDTIKLANKYRFNTVDYQNRDFCSSINVLAELELYVHSSDNLECIIDGIKSRIDLPVGFSKTLAHTWYVCAMYYYLHNNYSVANKYIYKAINESLSNCALADFRQFIRIKILEGDIRAAQAMKPEEYNDAKRIYMEAINKIALTYGTDNYYLIKPYRHLLKIVKDEGEKLALKHKYNILVNKYKLLLIDMEEKVNKLLDNISNVI